MKYSIILLVLIFYVTAFAGEWHVDKSKKNSAVYESDAAVLTFEGATDKLDGFVFWEGETLFESNTKIYFEVDLNTLDSGIGKRDSDMREILNTNKWGFATFEGAVDSFEYPTEDKNEISVVLSGKFFVNGVHKEMKVPGKIIKSAEGIKIESDFSIFLNDYNVEAPSLLAFVKVSEEIKLNLDFHMKIIN
ncbi:MAG: YceI family protein [Bacteroidetes bacterium]|nr:YceI family protein [Bacteroidota bacterium]